MAHAIGLREASYNQFRVTASLKFNRSAATCDQAACSATGIDSFRGDSPFARYNRAAPSSAAYRSRSRPNAPVSTASSESVGSRDTHSSNAHRNRTASSPDWPTLRSANARDASTNCTSLSITSACSGVVVDGRATTQVSRLGASNAAMFGGGTVRFQYVYSDRRYNFSP